MVNKYLSKIEPAFKNFNEEIETISSDSPTILKNTLIRIALNGKIYELNTSSKYSNYIYQTITIALKSDWYQSLSDFSKRGISTNLIFFIKWFNVYEINEKNKYKILKDYESFRVNIKKVKPQSSGLRLILSLIKQGKYEVEFNSEIHNYLDALMLQTNVSIYDSPIPETLTNYFSSIEWLRKDIGDDCFLKLESPKRLINSFSVTAATILLHIINVKKEAKKLYQHDYSTFNSSGMKNRTARQIYCANLFSILSKFDENLNPIGEITELMILDFVSNRQVEKLGAIKDKGILDQPNSLKSRLLKPQIFTLPNIFSVDSWDFPSELEQVLFSWLCAWQTVQPYDVEKLKKKDFIITRNSEGRYISLQCNYYKGRSGRIQEPPMLDSREIEARALLSYLEYFSNTESNLISFKNIKHIPLTFGKNSITDRLINLINHPPIYEEIQSNLWKRKASSIFIEAFFALYKNKEFSFVKWMNKLKRTENKKSGFTVAIYKNSVLFPLPFSLFGLNSIKNTAVHANSDKYRDGDLVNYNSHSSATEKISYLTDANKDWVNQNGRITRLVLHDFEKYVYKPNLDLARKEAHDMSQRTKVIKVLNTGISDSKNVKINSLGQVKFSKEIYQQNGVDADEIIVLDTDETVVIILHFINEANAKQKILIRDAVTFFERTVLPTVEWMEFLLTNKLSAPVIKSGSKKYEQIRHILPPLFLNEIRGGLGI